MHELFKETSRLRKELTSRDAGLNVGPSELWRPDHQIQEMKQDEDQDQLSIHIVEISLPFKVAFNFFLLNVSYVTIWFKNTFLASSCLHKSLSVVF